MYPPDGSDKKAWRRWAQQVADSQDASTLSRLVVDHLQAWIRPHATLLVFSAMPGEADLSALHHRGPVLLTRTPETGPLTVHSADAARETHPWGYSQPAAGTPEVNPEEIDVVLVPGAAFSVTGERLGHGKGYYDRLLATLRPGVERVGVTFDALVVPELPTEAHDVAMTHLATESGVRTV